MTGDFNTDLIRQGQLVGTASSRALRQRDAGKLVQILEKYQLCVLNTWNSSQSHTFQQHNGSSQIDFAMGRLSMTDGVAKQTAPLHSFPIMLGSNGPRHSPLTGSIKLVKPWHLQSNQREAGKVDARLLHSFLRSEESAKDKLNEALKSRLGDVNASSPKQLNSHLLAACLEVLPAKRNSAVAEVRLRTAQTKAMWAQASRACQCSPGGGATMRSLFQAWKAQTALAKMVREHKRQCRQDQRDRLESKLQDAEAAASKHDAQGLYRIVRSLERGVSRPRVQLRGSQGELLGPDEEVQCLLAYSSEIFARDPDVQWDARLTGPLQITAAELKQGLQRLGARKAVPKHSAPSVAWKVCSEVVTQQLAGHLQQQHRAGSSLQLEDDFRNADMAWIPKPFFSTRSAGQAWS